ncbi:hypothetical protein ACWDZ8_17285 [Streptomyces sp. NPDC003233]|uniref:hypothetical protein n=1 Tax=Streptomyces mirabilis TaxID=68239 RepID=UPI00365D8300
MFGTHGANLVTSITRWGEKDRVQSHPLPAENRELVNRYGLVDLVTGPYVQTLWDIKSQR